MKWVLNTCALSNSRSPHITSQPLSLYNRLKQKVICSLAQSRKALWSGGSASRHIAMENENNKTSINDLPLALIEEILLRLPIKSLLMLRCVCKEWLHLISDPNFAKSHFELATAPTRRCLFDPRTKEPLLSFDLDEFYHDAHAHPPLKVYKPFKLPSCSTRAVMGSCRGFILLDNYPHLVIWSPSTGAHKQISYSHIVSPPFVLPSSPLCLRDNVILYGFGYDASTDDYMVALAWRDDKNEQDHFDFFSVRDNSWKSFEVALLSPYLSRNAVQSRALFFNGAFHWLAYPDDLRDGNVFILVFDLKERSFSEIPLPFRLFYCPLGLIELGGCLASEHYGYDALEIWVMKEYKVPSSWKLYRKLHESFRPIGLSNDGDHIVGFDANAKVFSKYDVGRRLPHGKGVEYLVANFTVYTESLISLPNDDCKAKKNGR